MLRIVLAACFLVGIQGASFPELRRHKHLRKIFPNGKIVGGAPTTIDKVPHQVALEDTGTLMCGGSIISTNYILTAAHCTDNTPVRSISVRSGTSTLQSGGTVTPVESVAQNPLFSPDNLDYDVSVLKLATPLTFGPNQQRITLSSTEAVGGATSLITGWGTQEVNGDLSFTLQAVQVPVVDRKTCNILFANIITPRMICAGTPGKDSCQGDSGGALTIGGLQSGIVSWGYDCAAGTPGVYSNVPALKFFIDSNSKGEAKWSEVY